MAKKISTVKIGMKVHAGDVILLLAMRPFC